MEEITIYQDLISDIKARVRQGQVRASLSANAEMLAAYWDIGKMINQRQQTEGWGAGVIPRLVRDLKNELAEVKGFSARNISRMVTFYIEYNTISFLPPPVAKSLNPLLIVENSTTEILPPIVAKIKNVDYPINDFLKVPWTHHIILLEKIKDVSVRFWYMSQIIINGWSKDTLIEMIKSKLHERQGKATTNFELTRILPDKLKSSLPSIEAIEEEMSRKLEISR